jgi:hypothetical protein
MVKRLILARPDFSRDRLIPLLGIVEYRIHIKNNAPEREYPVPDNLTYAKFSQTRHFDILFSAGASIANKFKSRYRAVIQASQLKDMREQNEGRAPEPGIGLHKRGYYSFLSASQGFSAPQGFSAAQGLAASSAPAFFSWSAA